MKKIFFLPLLMLAITVQSQKDTSRKSGRPKISITGDSITAKIQRMKDSVDKTLQDIQQENNIRNLESVMNSIEKRRSKEKNKAILYIVIGVGMLIILIIGLRRRTVQKRS